MGACRTIDPARQARRQQAPCRGVRSDERDASGVRSRKICRRAAHFSTISTCGATTARWIASITCFMWRVGSKANEKPARPPPWWIAKGVRALKKGGWIDPDGYDAGKKVKGKKRHILVDTLGLLLHAIIHPADIQDRDGGILLLATLFGMYPFLKKLFADGGYQGPDFQKALAKILPQLETEIVKRSDRTRGFVVLSRRWVVERTFAWLNRCRRLAKDWENLNRNALAFLRLASIRLMLRKLCNPA